MKHFIIQDMGSGASIAMIDAKYGKTALKRFRMGLISSGCYEIHKENNEWILSSSYGSYFKAIERRCNK